MPKHVLKLISHVGGFTLIIVDRSENPISLFLVGKQTLQRKVLEELIYLFVHIRG